MTRETLDETIDRVAGELTAAGVDPTFADGVAQRLAVRRRPQFIPVLAGVSVAGALLIVVLLWPQAGPPASAARDVVVKTLAPLVPLPPAVQGGSIGFGEDWTTRSGVDEVTVIPPQIQAPFLPADLSVENAAPAPLSVAEVAIPPVMAPDIADIAPLDIAPLDVPELDMTYEAKEPQ